MWVRIHTQLAMHAVAYCGISGFVDCVATQRKSFHRGVLLPPNRRLQFIATERLSFLAFSIKGTVYEEWHRLFMPLPSLCIYDQKDEGALLESGF